MTLLLPIAYQTVLTVAAVLTVLAVVAYILKMRRRRFEVPFSTLWHRVLREKETTSLWKQLRRLLSLLLQLVILALLIVAVLDPQLGSADRDARNVVVIVDASASMKTVDEGPDGQTPRIEVARQRAHELLDAMAGGDAAMIMRMDGQTTPLSRMGSDIPMLHKVVDSIVASDTPADLRRALSAAADALRERKNPTVVLIGDGAYPFEVLDSVVWSRVPTGAEAGPDPAGTSASGRDGIDQKRLADIDLSGIDVRYLPVGKKGDNVGIVAFNARRYLTDKTNYSVFIELQNFGEETAQRRLVVYSGNNPIDVKTVTLQPGQRLRSIYPDLSGGQENRLRAELQPVAVPDSPPGSSEDPLPGRSGDSSGDSVRDRPDVFALDDEAFALLPARKKQKVLLVTNDNLYLEGAMLVYDSIHIDKLLPAEYEERISSGDLATYDAVFFDSYTPEKIPPTPSTHLAYFDPRGEHSPFAIRRTVEAPRITEIDEAHPVMRWVVMSDVNFDRSSVFDVDRTSGEIALARYVRAPIIAAKRDGQRKIAAFGFNLAGTDLTLRVAFPLLLVNTLDWFAGDDADLITTYQTGHRLRVPMDGTYGISEVEVVTPVGRKTRAPVTDGQARFYGNWIGVHRLVARDRGQVVAVVELAANLANPEESQVAPVDDLALGGRTLARPEGFAIARRQALWAYLAIVCLLLLAIEWVTYNRRITV
ncbi:MAG: VWA domain-containing protein [Proteobacteria bacterium]|nr:VWA domain-containing protein [Pseudomonadota bacterium]